MPSSGYSKVDITALKAIAHHERVDGSSWLVRRNRYQKPSWYTWIASDNSEPDDDAVVIPADNPIEGRFLKADAIRGEVLSSDRTYYVSAIGGNNSNDGLTPETSFATIQKFIDTITSIDLNGFNINCQVIPGTYNQPIQLKSVKTNGGIVIIDGGSSSNTIIQTTGDCVWGNNIEGAYELSNLTFSPTDYGNGANFYKCSDITVANCNFGLAPENHIRAVDSSITINDCDLTGNADNFIWCSDSNIQISTPSGARTVSGIRHFEDCVIRADINSRITIDAIYTGNITGIRYKLFGSSLLNLKIPASSLPGNTPGVVDNSQIIDASASLVSVDGYQSITGFKLFENGLLLRGTFFLEGSVQVANASYNNLFGCVNPGDPQFSFMMRTNGLIQWGDGKSAPDINLYRESSTFLRTDNSLGVGGNVTSNSHLAIFKTISDADNALVTYAPNHPYYSFRLTTSGKMMWGNPNGQFLADTFLYRNEINSLKTDGKFTVGLDLTVDGNITSKNTIDSRHIWLFS